VKSDEAPVTTLDALSELGEQFFGRFRHISILYYRNLKRKKVGFSLFRPLFECIHHL
jgi:hypothetical protein